ncbi:zeta toxin family protein [Streptomyces sp. 8K308]|uniref:zeta toxin family protein n=1 Tax=Streptomyces sp. 8K308 TaxID=2530388 RepID=UPI001FB71F39|nr:zeta toxin family protein [Streptomyces sp. 8K308]
MTLPLPWDAVVEMAMDDPDEFRVTAAGYGASGYRTEVAAGATGEALSQSGIVERLLAEVAAGTSRGRTAMRAAGR